jgi:hypothetical protein
VQTRFERKKGQVFQASVELICVRLRCREDGGAWPVRIDAAIVDTGQPEVADILLVPVSAEDRMTQRAGALRVGKMVTRSDKPEVDIEDSLVVNDGLIQMHLPVVVRAVRRKLEQRRRYPTGVSIAQCGLIAYEPFSPDPLNQFRRQLAED